MKMRKSTWLLLVLALAAILLVAGCAPTTPGNGDEEPGNGEPTADKACPKVVKTEVSKLYVADPTDDLTKPNFQIKITFDENINSSCIENLAKWAITVANADRVGTPVVSGVSVSVSGKVVTVKARVVETGIAPTTYELVELPEDWEEFDDLEDAIDAADTLIEIVEGFSLAELASFYFIVGEGDAAIGKTAWEKFVTAIEAIDPEVDTALAALRKYNNAFTKFGFTVEITQGEAPVFYGLICNQDDADEYKKVFGEEVKAADEVSWKLTDCAVYDDLGNVCCEFSGKACCVEPYCEECIECDLTTGICK